MSRNQNSLFSQLPSVNIKRSKFRRPQSVKFTGNTGVLIPFYVDEVLPGDTHQIKTNKVVRLQTPITPFMDQMYLDTYYFFVPNRLVWDHWKEFNGENNSSPWTPAVSYTVPKLVVQSNSLSTFYGSVLDYMGIPPVAGLEVNALPFRMYSLIWSEWFRDQSTQYPPQVYTGDNNENTGTSLNVPAVGASAPVIRVGHIAAVNKFHDYFTSCLPAPQKGPDVTITAINNAPVKSSGVIQLAKNSDQSGPFKLTAMNPDIAQNGLVAKSSTNLGNGTEMALYNTQSNLYADLSGISVATINQLRTAFQLQKMYEADARGGTRYTEILRQHFGVISPDARLQRPEYLGGNRIPINVHQVVQSSESGTTPQGNTAAYSLTVDAHGDFIRSFTEHGFIIGLCCVRYDHSYQQGLERFWSRSTRVDYFWPVLAHLGEQAVLQKEIYATGTATTDNTVFGYQEAWADYRYKPSRIAGEMRSTYSASLDKWHLGDYYSQAPSLSAAWIAEDKANVDRVLQVTSSTANQLLFDFYVENDTTRPMPVHSVPGLIDHF